MFNKVDRKAIREAKHKRVRNKISGTAERPRLSVFRSLNHIYAQVINDDNGTTLVAASTLDPALKGQVSAGGNVEAAKMVGRLVAEKALAKGIKQVVFDRGGNLYHGRIAALAEGAREAGLDF
ncbi:50S ribosomal protein L18 [Clostridiales bacterium PH28_bin88]|nr:50S ribosomal protein L18 [Clostridiales bacterium PH28_bin88]